MAAAAAAVAMRVEAALKMLDGAYHDAVMAEMAAVEETSTLGVEFDPTGCPTRSCGRS